MNPDDEIALLRLLEKRVRKMFTFSGWDDCDEDAAKCVHAVEKTLSDMTACRRVMYQARTTK